MSKISIQLIEAGSCRVRPQESGAMLVTDTPPEYGGKGRTFSATDLLAAALGVCIATNLDTVAMRHGIPLDAFTITVEKTLAQNPKRVAGLHVTVVFSIVLAPEVLIRFERAAQSCTVKRSLHPDVEVTIRIVQLQNDEQNRSTI